ncbi:MAG: 16S rRNA (guanine(527)-N(7))-methyltransferase RsmG, partial [Spirulinaceae cyanobacterium]
MEEIETIPEFKEVWQETLKWQPSNALQEKFQQLYEQVIIGNRQLNLTRITAPEEFWEKHLWDSLKGVAPWLTQSESGLKVMDIGTGAGFPGLPVALTFPHWQVTLLDSTRKKITFLDGLLPKLEIFNATTLVGRAESVGKKFRHHAAYDLTLVRAVGKPIVCAQYALPLLKPGAIAVLYRGQWTEEDDQELRLGLRGLGGKVKNVEKFF